MMKTMKANKITHGTEIQMGKPTEEMRKQDKLKEFLDTQKSYRVCIKSRLLKQSELEEIHYQLNSGEAIKMQWYGMPYPKKVLEATYNFELEDYVQRVNKEEELKKKLIQDFKLNDKDFEVIHNGKLINKLKK